jgi:hypothetical protein
MNQRRFEAQRDAGNFFTALDNLAVIGQFYPFHVFGVTFRANNPRRERSCAAFFAFSCSEFILCEVLVKLGNPVELRSLKRIKVHGSDIFTF